MKKIFNFLLFIYLILAIPITCKQLKFAIVPKNIDDINFIEVYKSANEIAKAENIQLDFVGPKGTADARVQGKELEKLLKLGKYDTIAISVIKSDLISNVLKNNKTGTPIITFDSDFFIEDNKFRKSYIGIDNIKYGIDLAKIAKKLKPTGGKICLMSSSLDSNLSIRLQALRQELSGNNSYPEGKPLSGEGGWTEVSHSPWNTGDSHIRALNELEFSLKSLDMDVFISVGDWPLRDIKLLENIIKSYKNKLVNKNIVLIVATGSITKEKSSLLEKGLIHGYVGIDFTLMGKSLIKAMIDTSNNKKIPEITYIPHKILIKK